jgi:hypothetical protein
MKFQENSLAAVLGIARDFLTRSTSLA